MAESVTRQVQGLRELGERMKLLQQEVQTKLARRATASAAGVVRKRARQLAPVADEPYTTNGVDVQPGNLARQTIIKRISRSQLTSEHIVTLRGNAKAGYAYMVGVFQEFGTVNHPAQPFLRPAFDESNQRAQDAMVKVLRQGIEKAAKGLKA